MNTCGLCSLLLKAFSHLTLGLLLALSLVASPEAWASEPDWDDVEVSPQNLVRQLDSFECRRSENHFFGCLVAVNRWAMALGIEQEFVPLNSPAHLKAPRSFGNFGRLVLIPRVRSNVADECSPREELQVRLQSVAQFLIQTRPLAQEFLKHPGGEFEEISQYLKEGAPTAIDLSKDKHKLVAIWNEYRNIAMGPHNYLISTKAMDRFRSAQSSEDADLVKYKKVKKSPLGRAGGLFVTSVLEKSAEESAGLIEEDLIVAIDKVSVDNLKDSEIKALIQRKDSRPKSLSIQRKIKDSGRWEKLELQFIARPVKEEPFFSEWLEAQNHRWLKIRWKSFSTDGLCDFVREKVKEGESQGASGYLLDLRDNPGGLISSVGCLAGIFIGPDQKIVQLINKKDSDSVSRGPQVTKKPVVVLQNHLTASSAEIFISALNEYHRIWIVGTPSYGKGSYQTCSAFQGEKTLMLCENAGLYKTPFGRSLQGVGIIPHFLAFKHEHAKESEVFATRELDRYPFALNPPLDLAFDSYWGSLQNRSKMTDSNIQATAAQKSCFEKNLAKKNESRSVEKVLRPLADYQIQTGLEILNCAL